MNYIKQKAFNLITKRLPPGSILPLNRVSCQGTFKKTVVAQFDQDHASSDGGAVLLKACDERLGLSASLAACLSDNRQPGKVKHSLQELFQQRMFGIACGQI